MCENSTPPHRKTTHEYWAEYVQEIKQTTYLNLAGLKKLIPHLMQEHPTYDWRSIPSFARELGVEQTLVTAAIEELIREGIVVQSSRNEDHYGLLERVKKSYPSDMWRQKGQFDVGQRLDPVTFQPCPPPCPAPANVRVYEDDGDHGYVESGKAPDMFAGMQECLREVQKLISTAQSLNEQVIKCNS